MPVEVELSTGRKVSYELKGLSLREFRKMVDLSSPTEDSDAIIAKVTGISPEQQLDMDYTEWREMVQRFFRIANNPVADPNS